MDRKIRLITWPDIDAAAIVGYSQWGDHVVHFKCYDGLAYPGQRNDLKDVKFQCGNSNWTADISKAEVFCRGGIKWDGCCNMVFEQDRSMLHFCDGPIGFANMAEMMLRVYDVATELMGDEYLERREIGYQAITLQEGPDLAAVLDRDETKQEAE